MMNLLAIVGFDIASYEIFVYIPILLDEMIKLNLKNKVQSDISCSRYLKFFAPIIL